MAPDAQPVHVGHVSWLRGTWKLRQMKNTCDPVWADSDPRCLNSVINRLMMITDLWRWRTQPGLWEVCSAAPELQAQFLWAWTSRWDTRFWLCDTRQRQSGHLVKVNTNFRCWFCFIWASTVTSQSLSVRIRPHRSRLHTSGAAAGTWSCIFLPTGSLLSKTSTWRRLRLSSRSRCVSRRFCRI